MNPILPEPDVSSLYTPPPPPSFAPPVVPKSTAIFQQIRAAVGQVFVGQEEVLNQVLAALLAGGHVLLEGKPGLGKTHLVLALSHTFGGSFRRIQFTPDLMPSDVCGHTLFDMTSGTFRVRRGPVFANLLLADEINRAPAKTQSSLLEVMQEAQVTIDGESHSLAPPFMTFATQNPIEQEGTYPLPEAQLDRFLLKVLIDYPDVANETWVVKAVSSRAAGSPSPISRRASTTRIAAASPPPCLPPNSCAGSIRGTARRQRGNSRSRTRCAPATPCPASP